MSVVILSAAKDLLVATLQERPADPSHSLGMTAVVILSAAKDLLVGHQSAAKSSHAGLSSSISATLRERRQALSCFSRAIAARTSEVDSA